MMPLRSALEARRAKLLRDVLEVQHHAEVEADDHRFEPREAPFDAVETLQLRAELAGRAGLQAPQRRVEEPAGRRLALVSDPQDVGQLVAKGVELFELPPNALGDGCGGHVF